MQTDIEIVWSERKRNEYPRELDEGLNYAIHKIRKTAEALGGKETDWELLKGKTVLDLACGSRQVPRSTRPAGWGFPPYYSLLCARAGADVWGVDLFPCDPKDSGLYHHVQADLISYVLSEKHLAGIPEIACLKFDVISSTRFADDNLPPDVIDRLRGMRVSSSDFIDKITQQSKDLLKPGGIIVFGF